MTHTPEDVSPKSLDSLISCGGTGKETPSTFTSCFHHAITNWYIFHTIIHTNKWWPQPILQSFNCFWKSSRTVCERLLLPHLRKTILLEKTQLHPWITKPQRIREWWPSKCHREFGHGTEYCLRETTIPHLKAVFAGSTLAKHLRILPLWILSPSDLRYPARYVRPVVNPWHTYIQPLFMCQI